MMARLIPSTPVRAQLWLYARLWVGYEFLTAGWGKLFGSEQAAFVGIHAGAGVRGFLTYAVSPAMIDGPYASVLPPYAWLARTILIPNAVPLGYVVAGGETLIGLALIVGLFTRVAALGGAFLNLMFLLAGTTGLNPYMFTIELSIVLAGVTAGLIGADYYALPFVKAQWKRWHAGHARPPAPLPRGQAAHPAH